MIRQLAHVCLDTDQFEALSRFYHEVLGLPIRHSFKNEGNKIFGQYFDCGGNTFIEVFDRALKAAFWGGDVSTRSKGTQVGHFCFEVIDLESFKLELQNKGISVGPISKGIDGSLQAWISDPDGNPIEFMQYTRESMQMK